MKTAVIALAGNPNVGKSTVFNALTGLHQHTGNWPGKTVASARGTYVYERQSYTMVDLPGTYSLLAHSKEEEVTRDYLCFEKPDAVLVVLDATCLERNLNLALQVLEVCPNTVFALNLMDEAQKQGLHFDIHALSAYLHAQVVPVCARSGQGLDEAKKAVAKVVQFPRREGNAPISYGTLEKHLSALNAALPLLPIPRRAAAVQLLCGDESFISLMEARFQQKLPRQMIPDGEKQVANALFSACEHACALCGYPLSLPARKKQLTFDKLLTGRFSSLPVLIALLFLVFYITLTGANLPSRLLSDLFTKGGVVLHKLMSSCPYWLSGALIDGMYRVLGWVVAVMLPPMAIFFPLFTLLEDWGLLPRIAFVLDPFFEKSGACGKQALTMCMGFGCNAVGVTGCRIIDSPRERLIAVLTNALVPCNGRFPTLIALMTVFFAAGQQNNLLSAFMLTVLITFALLCTCGVSKLLSVTLLRGLPSAFVLEMPPFRRPQIGRVLLRSFLDRTLFVLGRAVMIAAPAGLLLWVLGQVQWGGQSMLSSLCAFLDAPGRFLGMDGSLLSGFLLGLPANEIVLPVTLMAYQKSATLVEIASNESLASILHANGWTNVTALCACIFCLFHWPCSTTLLTIKKETGKWRWVPAAVIVSTLPGIILCHIIAMLV